MSNTKRELAKIAREIQSIKAQLNKSAVNNFLWMYEFAAVDAYEDGIRKVGDFYKYIEKHYASYIEGFPTKTWRAEAAQAWKMEKESRKPSNW